MKNHSLLITLVVCCSLGLMSRPLHAQKRTLSEAQLEAIVKPNLESCSTQNDRIRPASIIPTRNARAFPQARIAKTLNGIWQGRVIGDTKDVSVDYFWIVDMKTREGLIIALRNGKQTVRGTRRGAAAPTLTFLMCPHEGYIPSNQTTMIHQFVKVSDSIADAPRILEKATGLKLSKKQPPRRPNLSDLWQGLLASKYFSGLPAVAFAGALFKPIQIQPVASAVGPPSVSLKWNAEYRGGGTTSIKYTTGEPMIGVEHAQFVGTTVKSGDYLVSSPGNGKIWKVEASSIAAAGRVATSGSYDLAFDKVVLGPLE